MKRYATEVLDKILTEVTKPYQYIGEEMLSYNKNFEEMDVNVVFCFPDKYEIGSSNLGIRVLYELINRESKFYCDRAYAPERDFSEQLERNKLLLYGVESKIPLKYFDFVAISLQYELVYPTMLKMLELGGISIYSKDREEQEPIVMAGGPCAYNPMAISDFIDIFVIGDGEEVNIEICKRYQKLKAEGYCRSEIIKELSKIDGVYCPKYDKEVKKRVYSFTKEAQPTRYPIPYSSSVHDRATIEIRRGCGRMCRFCQAGHTNLPIRELEPNDVIENTLKLLSCTGFDEYSLLSLSSNDYVPIIYTIKQLSKTLTQKKISASLPSQRLDRYSVELADLIHQVRKTTVTLAPEAGSQRLRNVINKNISKEQIIETTLECYKNGYSSFKFYFMLGLPTETISDLDEFANLFKELFYRAKLLKNEFLLKENLKITASVSIFVPKPFTPFQWCAQDDADTIHHKMKYLKEITKVIKGLRVKIHDERLSQIESALSRAGKQYNNFIYRLYKSGVYLASWGENLDFKNWKDIARECGIDIEKDATKSFAVDEVLPWDFINVGITKEWFKTQYKNAMKELTIVPCEFSCSNCGVCKTFPKKKRLVKESFDTNLTQTKEETELQPINKYRYRIRITKPEELKCLSHLDWQNTIIKALYRSNLPVAFSQGFNPTPKLSLGIALPVFVYGKNELIDLELTEKISEDLVVRELQNSLPEKIKVIGAEILEPPYHSIESTVEWADYKITPIEKNLKKGIPFFEKIEYISSVINSSDDLFIEKKNKKGITKKLNIKNSISNFELIEDGFVLRLKTGQQGDIPALRPDVLMKTIMPNEKFHIERLDFYDKDMKKV